MDFMRMEPQKALWNQVEAGCMTLASPHHGGLASEFGSGFFRDMISQALSELKPSWQPDLEIWNKGVLKSFQNAEQPPVPMAPEDQEEAEPKRRMNSSVMSQDSKQTEAPSYETYMMELHPMDPGRPDRQLHDYGQQCLNGFLQRVSRRPKELEDEVRVSRRGPLPWWYRWL